MGPILAVLILAAAGYFIYVDTNKIGNIGPGIEGTGEAIVDVEQMPLTEGVPAPGLNRPLVFSAPDLTSELTEFYKQNIEKLVSALKSDPKQIDKWLELGLLYKQIGDYAGAEEVWKYIAEVSSEKVIVYGNLGDLYQFYIKNYPKAEDYMKKVIALKPDNVAGYRALYDLYTLSYKEKMPEALKTLSSGLAKNPDNYDLLVLTASYYKMVGDKVNAKIYYEKALAVADKAGMAVAKQAIEDEISNLSK